MTLEEALYAYLSIEPGLAALISDRIYPVALPQTPTLPAVTYMRVSAPTLQDFSGTIKRLARMQFDAWSTSYDEAHQVNDALIAALDNYSGLMGGVGGVQCDVTLMTDQDLSDPETAWKRVLSEYEIWY